METIFQFEVDVSVHPSPCPDCGARLILRRIPGRLSYKCEKTGCSGNAGAHESGAPFGIAINKAGRMKRVVLHNLIDKYWRNKEVTRPGVIRTIIYMYFNLCLNVEDFHIGNLSHEQLDQAIKIAQTRLPQYMAWQAIYPEEETGNEENLQRN